MTVRSRGSKWQADFMVKGTRHRAEFETREAAEAWELESRAKLIKGQPIERQSMARAGAAPTTIAALVDYVAEHHWKKQGSKHALHNACLFRDYVGPRLAIRDALTRDHIQAYAKQLEARGRSDGTVNRHISAISVLCKTAVELGAMDARPKGVVWHRKEAEGRIRYLDEREEAALLKTLTDWGYPDLVDFYSFLIDTGGRLGEVRKLAWREVRDNKYVTFLGVTTKNSLTRTIPLFPRSQAILERRRRDPLIGIDEGPWSRIDERQNMRLWPKLQAALPFLQDCVPHHVCRHTRASRFAIAGYDLVRIKEWMGHKNIQTTLKYAHLRPKHLEDMVA